MKIFVFFRFRASNLKGGLTMDILTAIKERRSCRSFSDEPIERENLEKILDAATWAPSPLNAQPWSFVVITGSEVKNKIFAEAERSREQAIQKSDWGWLGKYSVEFLLSAPVIVAVAGDPKKSGVDQFMEGGAKAYEHACAAAVQNMMLAAHSLDIGSVWFTLFDRDKLQGILDLGSDKVPLALVCLGKPAADPVPTPRKDFADKTTYL
jgi:5,6-dimethylbenzimidazole synthase